MEYLQLLLRLAYRRARRNGIRGGGQDHSQEGARGHRGLLPHGARRAPAEEQGRDRRALREAARGRALVHGPAARAREAAPGGDRGPAREGRRGVQQAQDQAQGEDRIIRIDFLCKGSNSF